MLNRRLRQSLLDGRNVIVDATNIKPKDRRSVFSNVPKNLPVTVEAVVLAVTPEECIARQAERERSVPEYAINRMLRSFRLPVRLEGFDSISVVRQDERRRITLSDRLMALYDQPHENPHHLEDMLQHSVLAYENAMSLDYPSSTAAIMLYHDIGKPETKTFWDKKTKTEGEIAHFYDHANVGGYLALCTGEMSYEEAVAIQWHMEPFQKECTEAVLEKKLAGMQIEGRSLAEIVTIMNKIDKESCITEMTPQARELLGKTDEVIRLLKSGLYKAPGFTMSHDQSPVHPAPSRFERSEQGTGPEMEKEISQLYPADQRQPESLMLGAAAASITRSLKDLEKVCPAEEPSVIERYRQRLKEEREARLTKELIEAMEDPEWGPEEADAVPPEEGEWHEWQEEEEAGEERGEGRMDSWEDEGFEL